MQPLLSFKNFRLWNSEKVFYNDVNFEIYPGDKYIFLGPNGSGKTLLMEILQMGISRDMSQRYSGLKASGSIFDSNGINLLIPSQNEVRRISYVPQFASFFENVTVKEQILNECCYICDDVSEDEVRGLLEAFDSKLVMERKIKGHLSGGEEKIVQLISGIIKARRANILLLDEPLNHLAFTNSARFNSILKEEIENNPQLAIIMITHCRAMDFASKEFRYDPKKGEFVITKYTAYDCFSIDDKGICSC